MNRRRTILASASTVTRPVARVAPSHDTQLQEGDDWDANAERGKIDWPVSREVANRFATFIREDELDDDGMVTREAAALPHHVVDSNGNPGAASRAGINAALQRLPQTQGLSDAEREAAERHLRNHLPDDEEEDRAPFRPNVSLGRNRDWWRISNQAGAATVDIFDEIGFWGIEAGRLAAELRDLDVESIDVRINSPGGDAFDGIAIYNALLEHPATVTVRVEGMAASAASVIAQAGDRVLMASGSQMMIHDAFGVAVGPAAEMRKMADDLDKVSTSIANIYAERSGVAASEIRELMLAESWFTAQEAVDAGLADEVVKVGGRRGRDDIEDSWDLSVFAHAGRSKAPDPTLHAPDGRRQPVGIRPVPVPQVEHRDEVSWDDVELDPEILGSLSEALTDAVEPLDGYDPDAVRAAIADPADSAPAPPGGDAPPDTQDLPDMETFTNALWEALR